MRTTLTNIERKRSVNPSKSIKRSFVLKRPNFAFIEVKALKIFEVETKNQKL